MVLKSSAPGCRDACAGASTYHAFQWVQEKQETLTSHSHLHYIGTSPSYRTSAMLVEYFVLRDRLVLAKSICPGTRLSSIPVLLLYPQIYLSHTVLSFVRPDSWPPDLSASLWKALAGDGGERRDLVLLLYPRCSLQGHLRPVTCFILDLLLATLFTQPCLFPGSSSLRSP